MPGHLFLIGYRGSGKSTVGQRLADRLGWPFVDTDSWIEQKSGLSIREIFARDGEPGFREQETQAIRAVCSAAERATVVSLGGGAVLRPENQLLLREHGTCVYLKGSAEELWKRIAADQSTQSRRPNLSVQGGFEEVVELLCRRSPVYENLAQKTVVVDGQSPDEVVDEILAWVSVRT